MHVIAAARGGGFSSGGEHSDSAEFGLGGVSDTDSVNSFNSPAAAGAVGAERNT